MKQVLFFLLACMLFPTFIAGQCTSQQPRPTWLSQSFKEEANSYIEVVAASGTSENDARNNAAQEIVKRRSSATGARATITNGVISINNDLTVKSRILDEYRERCSAGEYRVTLLVQTAKNPTFEFDRVGVSDIYPFSTRMFVPSMAQFYKGSTGKGIFFLGAEVAALSGTVYFESMRANNFRKSQETTNLTLIKEYRKRADSWELYRNIGIGAAAGVYLWNVLDAALAKGKIRYISENVHLKTSQMDETFYFGLAINF